MAVKSLGGGATQLVAVVGRPNVGKSSLFNRLTGRRQAVVDDAAGTTRDANYGTVEWRGGYATLVDTGGIDRANDDIEAQVQEQIRQVADIAQLIVVVVDAAAMVTAEDQQAARLALQSGHPVILVLNKIDTATGQDTSQFLRLGIQTIVETSAIHGRGTGDLLDAVWDQIASTAGAPTDPTLRLALLGRPNVGKSSLLNAMVGKQQAVVSATAGTTRDVGTATIRYHEQAIELLDTAGLRRRGKIEAGVEKYSALRTLASIARADIGVLLVDATELAVAGDLHIAGQVVEEGKGLIIAVNKWDAVDKDDSTQARVLRRLQQQFQFAWWAPVVFVSATTGLNVAKLFELAVAIHERRGQQLPTGPLNRVIEKLVTKQAPAGLKNRRPKLNYATQTGTNPPTITCFTTSPELIHFSYARYLENGLRAAYDFDGTPIRIEFRNKRKETK